MYSKTVTIVNKTGLHARPASEFVSKASKFKSKITIKKNVDGASEANAKSIVILLTLGLSKGTEIVISADGEDEKDAVDTLVQLVESGFGEVE